MKPAASRLRKACWWGLLHLAALAAIVVLVVLMSGSASAQTPLSEPTSVTVAASVNAATIDWQPPASDGGSPIIAYQVSIVGHDPVEVLASDRSYTFRGLAPGQPVQLQVRAQNGDGYGPWSTSMSATPEYGPLSTVVGVHVLELSDTSIRIQWDPAGNTAAYRVQWREGSESFDAARQVEVQDTSYDVSSLPEGVEDEDTTYYARVRAQTAVSGIPAPPGAWSEEADDDGFSSPRELLAHTPGGDWLTQAIIGLAAGIAGFVVLLKVDAGASKALAVGAVMMILAIFALPVFGFGSYWLGFVLVIVIVLGGAAWTYLSR